mmetsp:Transcript_29797/g.46074  ORF Transcript_29797/g.46074 Transcript_29797/m.46074 type:complete len:95 (-) Transcript_29797:749-1033(-)
MKPSEISIQPCNCFEYINRSILEQRKKTNRFFQFEKIIKYCRDFLSAISIFQNMSIEVVNFPFSFSYQGYFVNSFPIRSERLTEPNLLEDIPNQ